METIHAHMRLKAFLRHQRFLLLGVVELNIAFLYILRVVLR